jgi:phosphoribosyl 1,2-cyclic phosphodiesterase
VLNVEIKFLGTGSAGNCIAIQSNGVTVLVDCGVPKTKIEKRLIENGINPGEIDAIFLTHAHGDHTKGLPLAGKWNIPVYASEGTWKSLEFPALANVLKHNKTMITYGLHNFDIRWFKTHHDDYDSLGFTFVDGDNDLKTSVCLDTGKVDADMIEAMRGSDVYIIEANYDESMLEANERYPSSVKARILSDIGHLSNDQTAEALAQLVTGKGERIFLCHMSTANNMPVLAQMAVNQRLAKKGFKEGKHYHLGGRLNERMLLCRKTD